MHTISGRFFYQALLFLLVQLWVTDGTHAQQIDTMYTDLSKVREIIFKIEDQTRFIEFDARGKKVAAIRHEGKFNGCNMPVGTDSLFDKKGRLCKTLYYDNRKSEKEEGCSATWTAIETKTYYKNEKIKSVAFEKTCYECARCACGTWIWYDRKGRMVQTINKGDCYDQLPCPQ